MRVLVVDDSLVATRQLTSIIESIDGFEVVGTARNGAEAVRRYQELAPELVCMDIVMPVMDGLEATRAIMQLDPAAKIVVISSVAGQPDRGTEALRLGAKSIIAKPMSADVIRDALVNI